MKKTLLASALVLAFGLSGAAFADQGGDRQHGSRNDHPSLNLDYDLDQSTTTHTSTRTETRNENSVNKESGDAIAGAARSVALNNGSWGTFSNAFNQTTATATSSLSGTVSHNHVMNVGNSAHSFGSADGGFATGGDGGSAGGGKAMGMVIGGKGGSSFGALGGSTGEAEVGDVHTGGQSTASNGDGQSGNGGAGGTAAGGAGGAGSAGTNLASGGAGGGATRSPAVRWHQRRPAAARPRIRRSAAP